MGTDEEIRQRRRSGTATAPIAEIGFAGKKGSLIGDGFSRKCGGRQGVIDILYADEADRHFRIDDCIDYKDRSLGCPRDRLR